MAEALTLLENLYQNYLFSNIITSVIFYRLILLFCFSFSNKLSEQNTENGSTYVVVSGS